MKTVDITPNWSGLVRAMCDVLESSNTKRRGLEKSGLTEAKKMVREEFVKMARAADIAIEIEKRESI